MTARRPTLMDQDLNSMFGFAPDHDSPIPYM